MATTFALHIDCDPLWIYGQEYGLDVGHEQLIYRQALPAFLEAFERHGVKGTFFLIGKELAQDDCRSFCRSAVSAGHALANHTYNHFVDFGHRDDATVRREIVECDRAIREATGVRPRGFRAPGYSNRPYVGRMLAELGYLYDSSVLPGPAALMMAAYLRMRGKAEGKSFSVWRNLFASRRIKPAGPGGVAQVPIAVLPYTRLPVHTTFIYQFGLRYLDFALWLLSTTPGHHVLLFHAIDLLDHPDRETLSDKLVPMRWSQPARRDLVDRILQKVRSRVVLTENYFAGSPSKTAN